MDKEIPSQIEMDSKKEGEFHRELTLIKIRLKTIEDKLDKIIEGPIFKSTLTRIGSLEEICASNLKSLNNMILQVKGIVTQVNTFRGRKSAWGGEELQANRENEVKMITKN